MTDQEKKTIVPFFGLVEYILYLSSFPYMYYLNCHPPTCCCRCRRHIFDCDSISIQSSSLHRWILPSSSSIQYSKLTSSSSSSSSSNLSTTRRNATRIDSGFFLVTQKHTLIKILRTRRNIQCRVLLKEIHRFESHFDDFAGHDREIFDAGNLFQKEKKKIISNQSFVVRKNVEKENVEVEVGRDGMELT